jgi:hypothetical protein
MAYKQWAKELLKCEMYGVKWDAYNPPRQPRPPKEFWPQQTSTPAPEWTNEESVYTLEEMARRAYAIAKHKEMFPLMRQGHWEEPEYYYSRKAKAEWIRRTVDDLIAQNPEVVA